MGEQIRSVDPITLKAVADTVCALRWRYIIVKYSLAQVRTCCRTFPNEEVSQEALEKLGVDVFSNSLKMLSKRKNMLSGIRDVECNVCWKLEDANVKSPRTSVPEFLDHMVLREGAPNSLEAIVGDKDKFSRSNHPTTIEIQMDNTCDLKCIYCKPEYSSRWEAELVGQTGSGLPKPSETHLKLFHETFWKWLSEIHNSVEKINFLGGEPMMSENFYKIAQRISSEMPSDGKPRTIGIVSNFNANRVHFERFLNVVSTLGGKFSLVIDASAEALGQQGEFIRQGLNWNRFERNFCEFAELVSKRPVDAPRVDLGLQIANNLFSIASMPKFLSWALDVEKKYAIPIHLRTNVVTHPEFLSPLILPAHFSGYLREAAEFIENNHVDHFSYGYGATWSKYAEYLLALAEGIQSASPTKDSLRDLKAWLKNTGYWKDQKASEKFPEYKSFFEELNASI